MTDQDDSQSPKPLRTLEARLYVRDRQKCLERGCRNLETRCNDCGRLVCDKTLPDLVQWISVKDRLPQKNDKYLTWNGYDTQFHYFEDGYFLMSIGLVIRYVNDEIPFTHWMPLPQPPKE